MRSDDRPEADTPPGLFAVMGALLRMLGLPAWLFPAVMAFAFGVPALFVGLGAWLVGDAAIFANRAFPVEAVVLRMEVDSEDDGDVFLRPVLAFDIAGGARQERPMHEAATSWPFGPGDTVTALWNPERPETVRLPGLWNLYGGGAMILALGLGALAGTWLFCETSSHWDGTIMAAL